LRGRNRQIFWWKKKHADVGRNEWGVKRRIGSFVSPKRKIRPNKEICESFHPRGKGEDIAGKKCAEKREETANVIGGSQVPGEGGKAKKKKTYGVKADVPSSWGPTLTYKKKKIWYT